MSTFNFKDYLEKKVSEQRQNVAAHKARREHEAALLPPDLTGHVWSACRDEAALVKARIDFLERAVMELRPKLTAARDRIRAASQPIRRPVHTRRFNILFDSYDGQPMETVVMGFMKTEKALNIQKEEWMPLLLRLQAYEFELTARQQELHELRKIAEAAAEGDVRLIHFLSAKWKSRFGFGGDVEGMRAKLSMTSVLCDAAGHPLPPEAIRDGMPDLPTSKASQDQERDFFIVG
jgi:hypothetical protein